MYRGAVVGDDLPGCTVIGEKNIIGHHAVVGIKCQDMKYKVGSTDILVCIMQTIIAREKKESDAT